MGTTRSRFIPFFESFHDQGKLMSKRARREFYDAIITYRFEGTEPTDLCKEAYLAWVGVRPILEKARAESERRANAKQPKGERQGDSQGTR